MRTTEIIDLFRHSADVRVFSAGQIIFKEGDPGNEMYVVKEGEVDILVHDVVLETVGPGGILGEMALIDTKARSATAVAKTDCKLVPIDERRFTFLIQQTPYFSLYVMRVLAGRLRQTDTYL